MKAETRITPILLPLYVGENLIGHVKIDWKISVNIEGFEVAAKKK